MDFLLPWAAGFIDGDGSIHFQLQKSRGPNGVPWLALTLSASQKDVRPLEVLETLFGGEIYQFTRSGRFKPDSPLYGWRIKNLDAANVLERLQPFFILKGTQAWLAREAMAQQRSQGEDFGRTVSNRGGSPYSDREGVTALRTGYCLAMGLLNGKEV